MLQMLRCLLFTGGQLFNSRNSCTGHAAGHSITIIMIHANIRPLFFPLMAA